MQRAFISSKIFPYALAALLLLGFAVLQWHYITRFPLWPAEFSKAAEIYRLLAEVPYRDFIPSDSQLGNYLFLPGIGAKSEMWSIYLGLKRDIFALNIFLLVVAFLLLRKLFSPLTVALALLAVLPFTDFLERSGSIQTASLSAWMGMLSLLLLLRFKMGWAGFFAALSFYVSQKGSWFVLAGFIATFFMHGVSPREVFRQGRIQRYFIGLMLVTFAYFGLAATQNALFPAVQQTLFNTEGFSIATANEPASHFWTLTISRNPLFYILMLLALGLLLKEALWPTPGKGFSRRARERVLFSYCYVFSFCFILFHKPGSEFLLLLFPLVWMLSCFFIEHVLKLSLPIKFAPFLVPSLLLLLLLGSIPNYLRIPHMLRLRNDLQKDLLAKGEALLKPEDTYLAGVELWLRNQQSIADLRKLDADQQTKVQTQHEAITTWMIDQLRSKPPLFVLWNSRLEDALPERLITFISKHYLPFCQNLWLRAMWIEPKQKALTVLVDGNYTMYGSLDARLFVGGKTYRAPETVALKSGTHRILVQGKARLVYRYENQLERCEFGIGSRRDFFEYSHAY